MGLLICFLITQNSKNLTLTLARRRIRRTKLAGSWEFLWLISCYTNDQCWPQKPHGTVKNSFRNRIDLISHFFQWKKSGFCLKKSSWKICFLQKKMMIWSKSSKKFAAKGCFQPKMLGCASRELQLKRLACLAAFPLVSRGSCGRLLPSPPGMAPHHKNPL